MDIQLPLVFESRVGDLGVLRPASDGPAVVDYRRLERQH